MSQHTSHHQPASMTPTTHDLLAEHLSAMRTAAVIQSCALDTRTITLYKYTHDEACFNTTMVRHSLVRAGYDHQARGPCDGVVMTPQMLNEEVRLQNSEQVIINCRTIMAGINFRRGAALWNEREDVVRDGAAREERKRKREEAEARAKELEKEVVADMEGERQVG